MPLVGKILVGVLAPVSLHALNLQGDVADENVKQDEVAKQEVQEGIKEEGKVLLRRANSAPAVANRKKGSNDFLNIAGIAESTGLSEKHAAFSVSLMMTFAFCLFIMLIGPMVGAFMNFARDAVTPAYFL